MNEQFPNHSSGHFLKTDGGKTKSNAIEIPSISLPKGGGSIRGIDEKFSVNPANGTFSFSVPLPFAAARGALPSIAISYNSGGGNSTFGMGWNLNIPTIKRKTEKTLPQYLDPIDSDTYLFSDAEDLVPEFKKEPDGSFSIDSDDRYIIKEHDSPDGLYLIRHYKPRIEGLFARIERWTNKTSGSIKWRVITKENTTTLFGWSDNTVISDPTDPMKIYQWLPEFIFDDKGNCSHYIYKREDDSGVDYNLIHNKNRKKNAGLAYTNLYLEKVFYGNKTPYKNFGDAFIPEADYMFKTVFDYGEYETSAPFLKSEDWTLRPDPFSDYKPGFEIRTARLCKRVLLYHFFAELPGGSALVKSSDLEYSNSAGLSFLTSITTHGYIKQADGTYTSKSLPPVQFEYQKHNWNSEVKDISPESLIHAPTGIDEQKYQFTDLYNEGLSGLLSEQANGWYYKQNLGNGLFDKAKLVSPKPSFSGLGAKLQLADLEGDGGKQLVNYSVEPRGYFELDNEDNWQPFKSFQSLPNVDFSDGNARMLDLNGDGKPELLLTEDHVFNWYSSEGRLGFSNAKKTIKPSDEEAGPHVLFANAKQSIFLADMSGDGLTDIVRIRNGEVCYWPNLGYGKFGTKVAMDNSPVFDSESSFNPAYIKLADIDGSGTTDIVYLGRNKFNCWMNLCGNSFSRHPFEIESFPEINDQTKVTVTDLLGNGVACIVWSSPLPGDSGTALRYLDLMNSKKPHLMTAYKNNFGKEVLLEYAPSTRFYIEDKLSGRPWITKLHFPVHCIAKTETIDKISGQRFVTSYKYHHGYYDHPEKEFRGFGMVEQIDTEHFEHWLKGTSGSIVDKELHQDPVVTKSWSHTGAFVGKERILSRFEKEYWYEEMNRQGFLAAQEELPLTDERLIAASGIPDSVLNTLTAADWREALRACKGALLRKEVFALDAPAIGATADQLKKQLTPYLVSAHNCVIELLQPRGQNKHAVFILKESENISYHYERDTVDPRVAHMLNIKLDEYANVLESAAIVYPKKIIESSLPAETQQAQSKTSIIYSKNSYTNNLSGNDVHRLPLQSELKTFELRGVAKASQYYKVEDFVNILDDTKSSSAEYHETDKPLLHGKAQKRLIEHSRNLYYHNNLSGPLPLHELQSPALPFESYQLAYTPALLHDIYGSKATDALMTEGKFSHSEGDSNWWIRSGRSRFIANAETDADARDRFYTPISFTDPFEAETKVKYYSNYFLFVEETEDALGNRSAIELFNFRTLSPQRIRDINKNLSETITDELGLVKATAVFGKGTEADDLADLQQHTSALEQAEIDNFLGASTSSELIAKSKTLLKHATTRFVYDLHAYQNKGEPVVCASIVREEHFQKNSDSLLKLSFEYTGGMGNLIMTKTQAEPGIAKKLELNIDGSYTINAVDTATLSPKQLRWIGNGRTILNNKGNAVKQYEPYFSTTHAFENNKELVETGVTAIMHYDANNRLIKTVMPDGSLSRTEFDAWKQSVYDPNDVVLESDWYNNRINNLIDAQLLAEGKDPAKEKAAAEKAAKHANTPGVLHLDTFGRPVLSVDHNKNPITNADEYHRTKIILDVEGSLRRINDARELPENGHKGNTVMEYKYDMLGNKVYQKSMDCGQRWLLSNVMGNPLRNWDDRNQEFQFLYDILHRPTQSLIIGGDGPDPLNHIFEKIVYGENLLSAGRANEAALQAKNILGNIVEHFDTGGVVLTPEFDFKGQPKYSTRKLFKHYKSVADWTDANLAINLENQEFTFRTETDALGRISKQTTPSGDIITPSYNETGLFNGESVVHTATSSGITYIKDIDYNEKGMRNKIVYGNNVVTRFYYDSQTFRLKRLESKRLNNDLLQDWHYTYDAAGNITHIEDRSVPKVFFGNEKVIALSEYSYDALYRLTEAKGRENDTTVAFGTKDNWNDMPFMQQLHPADPLAMRNYTQRYRYDEAGNITEIQHLASGNNWTRTYENEKLNNRLKSTTIGANTYSYNYHIKHGFALDLPQLEELGWNFKEELSKTIRQKVDPATGTPETTYYQYDGQGKRLRKITENFAAGGAAATIKDERVYISGYETYRKYQANTISFERESLSLIDQGNRFVLVETVKSNSNVSAEPSESIGSNLTRYQLNNYIGSASLELDSAAQVISYEEFHPFGTTAYQARNANIKAAAKRYRFTGMERDEETGLSYHSARYYIPWLGRWLNTDPIGIKDGVNLYAYCKGNPVKCNDRSGSQAEDPPLQCHLIEQPVIETRATQSSYSQEANIRRYVRNMAIMWGEDPSDYESGHHPSTPQWSSRPGDRQLIGPQHWAANNQQSVVEAADRRAAALAGQYHRTARRHTGAPIPNGPRVTLPQDVMSIVRSNPKPITAPQSTAAPMMSIAPSSGSSTASTGQQSFFFMNDDPPQATPAPVRPPSPPRPPAPAPQPTARPQVPLDVDGPPVSTTSSGGGARGVGNAVANSMTQIVPGSAESLMAAEALAPTAARMGAPRLMSAAMAGARMPGPAIAGGIVGAPVGVLAEGVARDQGLSETASTGVGVGAAVLTGAAVGVIAVAVVATAPVTLTVAAGAALVGGLAAGFGYLTSRVMR